MPCAKATSRPRRRRSNGQWPPIPIPGALLRNLASAHRGAGDDEAELKALEQALDIDRRDLVAWMRKAELHQRRDEKGEAFQAWNVALQLAEPLRPWSGPMAESLERGLAFAAEGRQAIRGSVERRWRRCGRSSTRASGAG